MGETTVIRETGRQVSYRTRHGERKETKAPAIGGPLDGQLVTRTGLDDAHLLGKWHPRAKGGASTGYYRYNSDGSGPHKSLWVYMEKMT